MRELESNVFRGYTEDPARLLLFSRVNLTEIGRKGSGACSRRKCKPTGRVRQAC